MHWWSVETGDELTVELHNSCFFLSPCNPVLFISGDTSVDATSLGTSVDATSLSLKLVFPR